MVAERLTYSVEVQDETDQGADEVERSLGGLFDRLGRGALQVGGQLILGIEQAVNYAQTQFRNLRIATGTADEETQELLSSLLGAGLQDDAAIAGIGALQGVAGQIGVDRTDFVTAERFAQVAAVGADPTSAAQALTSFGVSGQRDVVNNLSLAITQGLSQGVDAGPLLEALRNYGPVLSAFGLNFLESAALIADLAQQGIDFSRVSPALNRFIRDASATGTDPRLAGAIAFERLRDASDTEAAALGQELFGAEGGLRLTQAIRSGDVGLGEQLFIDPAAVGADLGELVAPTDRERFQADIREFQTSGNFLQRLVGGVAGGIENVPFVGGALAGVYGAGRSALDPVETGPSVALAVFASQQREQTERIIDLLERQASFQERGERILERGGGRASRFEQFYTGRQG